MKIVAKLKEKKRDILIVVSSIILIAFSSMVLFVNHKVIGVNQMMMNQQFVFDATFKDENAIREIGAPKIERRNWISTQSLHYSIKNIKSGDNNYGYFVFPINNLKPTTKYKLNLSFNFFSQNEEQQELLFDVVDQDVMQSPSSKNNETIISSIDNTAIQARQFVLPGVNVYQQELNFSSNPEGKAFIVIGLDINKSDYIDFWINGLRINTKEEIIDDNIIDESKN